MIKDYPDFIKPIKEIMNSLIEADYKTIESQGWDNAEHAERIVNGERERYFKRLDRLGQRSENPPKGLYWLDVPHDEEIKDNLKENSFLIDTRPYDKVRFPNLSDDIDDEYCCYLDSVIDGEIPITDSTWHVSIRLISKDGTWWGSLILEALIKDNSLSFDIECVEI